MKKFLFVLAMSILPVVLFAKGDVVAYLPNYRNAPTDAQLDRLTHLVLFSITPGAGGTAPLPSGGWAKDIGGVVNSAHNKGVKVIIALGGWEKTGSFVENVQAGTRQTFVNNIVNMVNANNFDGVDIDWEYPTGNQQKNDFADFMADLKTALGNKRLSFAIGASYKPDEYSTKAYNAMDALHLMTYDMGGGHHADEAKAEAKLDEWINSGKIAKEKVFLGVPFYGRGSAGEETYAAIINSDSASLSQANSKTVYIDGQPKIYNYDGIPTIKSKTRYAYERDAGGIMIWELGQDVPAANRYSLLNAIYQEVQELKGSTGYKITVKTYGGGSVKKGDDAVESGSLIDISVGGDLTLTFNPDGENGYEIGDVKINGVSDNTAKTQKSHTFSDVKASQTIEVFFAKRHSVPVTFNSGEYSSKSPEIAYNNDEHGKYVGNLVDGSFLEYLVNVAKAGNYNISLKSAVGANGQYGRAEISIYDGNSETALGKIEASVGEDWYAFVAKQTLVALSEGNKTLRLVSSGPVNIEDITILTEQGGTSITQSGNKNVSSVGVSIINGRLNLSLPSNANNAHIVLFDVRGRILFERNVVVNGNFASVALPKSISRNQVMMLQVKTNSGVNMTKRILIK
ncbi:MAG: carbohydrate-binding protein [Chitinispirillales bacterium]|jgi:hypothetical protein|nr:carbohydrate-binding protein [Chitinispirillales bacterium]